MADFNGTATTGLVFGQEAPGKLVVGAGNVVTSLAFGFRFHHARGRVVSKSDAVVTGFRFGMVAGNSPGHRSTR